MSTTITAPVAADLAAGALVIATSLYNAEKGRKAQAEAIFALRKDNGGKFTDEEIHAQIVTAHRDLHPARIRATVKAPVSLATVSNLGKAHSLHVEAGLKRVTDETFRIAYNAMGHTKADRRNAIIAAVAALPEGKRESAFVTELTLAVKGKESTLLTPEAAAEVAGAEAAEKAEADAAPFSGAVKLSERLLKAANDGKIAEGDVATVIANLQATLAALAKVDPQAQVLTDAAEGKRRGARAPRSTHRTTVAA